MLEAPISIKKVEERLSRQLLRRGLGQKVEDNLLKMAATLIGKDTLLILDPSDIRKKYAKKMQYLATVHDGSEDELGNGYWTCNVVGTEVGGSSIVPLLGRLYSAEAPGFLSENHEILTVVDMVAEAVKKRGLWVIDRGGDRKNLMIPMRSYPKLEHALSFTRMKRPVCGSLTKMAAFDLLIRFPKSY